MAWRLLPWHLQEDCSNPTPNPRPQREGTPPRHIVGGTPWSYTFWSGIIWGFHFGDPIVESLAQIHACIRWAQLSDEWRTGRLRIIRAMAAGLQHGQPALRGSSPELDT
ncbi:unnamed protein product, partial [Iphiclides podalirius]